MTSPSPAIADTSVLSALAKIWRLDLLKLRFAVVLMPEAVWMELQAGNNPEVVRRITAAQEEGIIRLVRPLLETSKWQPPLSRLGPGETAVLALAMTQPSAVVLMDERRGRRAARMLGCSHSGVLGLLAWAKRNGHLPSLAQALAELRAKDFFFVDEELLRQLLESVGESSREA